MDWGTVFNSAHADIPGGGLLLFINWLSSVTTEETNQITLKSVRKTLY